MQNVNTLCIAAQSPQDTHATYGIVQRTQSDRMANGNRLDSGRNPIGRRTETSGDVPPTDAPTKQTERVSHRIRGTHRTFWQRKPPTDRHRCAQIRRVWHPAIPTPPITQPNHLWKSVKSVGEYYHAGAAASAAPTKQTERVFPQNTRNTQNLLAEKASHR